MAITIEIPIKHSNAQTGPKQTSQSSLSIDVTETVVSS